VSSKTRQSTKIRPVDSPGAWFTNANRYCHYVHFLLTELETVISDVKKKWPIPLEKTIRNPDAHPEIRDLVRKRDSLADSITIFTAMAVEAFINFYGVVRIGEDGYQRLFERLGAIPKLQTLLLVCDSLSVSTKDPLIKLLERITTRRNNLVHPKTQETKGYVPGEKRPGSSVPKSAREAVQDMLAFFKEFEVAVPGAAHLIPSAGKSV
jgi:hypothetical protein